MRMRKLAGYGAMVGSVAFGVFCYDPNTKTFNNAFPYAIGAGALSYWMITGKSTKYDGWISLLGLGAGIAVISGIAAFKQEYGGGGTLI